MPDMELRILGERVERLERLERWLHSIQIHPDFEYATTKGQRKAWDDANTPPEGEGWERNVDKAAPDGWERFEYHEESYWRRPKPADVPSDLPDDSE